MRLNGNEALRINVRGVEEEILLCGVLLVVSIGSSPQLITHQLSNCSRMLSYPLIHPPIESIGSYAR